MPTKQQKYIILYISIRISTIKFLMKKVSIVGWHVYNRSDNTFFFIYFLNKYHESDNTFGM